MPSNCRSSPASLATIAGIPFKVRTVRLSAVGCEEGAGSAVVAGGGGVATASAAAVVVAASAVAPAGGGEGVIFLSGCVVSSLPNLMFPVIISMPTTTTPTAISIPIATKTFFNVDDESRLSGLRRLGNETYVFGGGKVFMLRLQLSSRIIGRYWGVLIPPNAVQS